MHPIIYDVAVSLDGYLSGPNGDVSAFAHQGPMVEDYIKRLTEYGTVLMGRATYEFAYAHGLEPGQNPYPHLKTYVFSHDLQLPETSEVTVVPSIDGFDFTALRANASAPVYLCGGGAFAGAMLTLGLIDQVILKRNPIILGGGVKLFEGITGNLSLQREDLKHYANGQQLEVYRVPTG